MSHLNTPYSSYPPDYFCQFIHGVTVKVRDRSRVKIRRDRDSYIAI